eukprot:3768914-Alexandrium_andersonii.AAC.1
MLAGGADRGSGRALAFLALSAGSSGAAGPLSFPANTKQQDGHHLPFTSPSHSGAKVVEATSAR